MPKYIVTFIAVEIVEADDPDDAACQLGEHLESATGGGGPWPGLHIEGHAELLDD